LICTELQLNIDYVELGQFTEKTELECGAGVVNPSSPLSSSIATATPKPLAARTSSRLTPWYEQTVAARTPATLLTNGREEDKEVDLGSPAKSASSSTVSSTMQTRSNADADCANVIVAGV
jgi:hypothetical protein